MPQAIYHAIYHTSPKLFIYYFITCRSCQCQTQGKEVFFESHLHETSYARLTYMFHAALKTKISQLNS